MDKKRIVDQMTLKEKVELCDGSDFWHSACLERLSIKRLKMSDGPHGLRCQGDDVDMFGINKSLSSTCFPTAVTAAASWNEELFALEGAAIGKEALKEGVSVVLGPACNIKRNPLGGRNFEYISEDPYLSGKMAAAFIRGQQSVGASSCVKHFALNNQEYKRQNSDSLVDDRTAREIYLYPFELAVKEGAPDALMCAYNLINGVHASDNSFLLSDLLRDEWGFDGVVITDWGAMNDRIEAFKAGCDLNMPGGSGYMGRAVRDAVKDGRLDEEKINASVRRILGLVEKHENDAKPSFSYDEHNALAEEIALQGAVLLKNEGALLPLDRKSKVCLIGAMAKDMRYQGSGSSHINPISLTDIAEEMSFLPYYPCGDANGNVSDEDIRTAINAAREHESAIVVVGLPDVFESEGFDREHMCLPTGYNKLVDAVTSANGNTVIVLVGGSVVELPWADRVRSILFMGLSGQAGGRAAVKLIFGERSPSGKLTESWPMKYDDVVSRETFGVKDVEYREGIFVGYRYYDSAELDLRFPFGHGLSYSSFDYGNATVEGNTVRLTVKNSGAYSAAEIVQLYVAASCDGVYRPRRELKGFARVELDVGEEKEIVFSLDERSFSVWDNGWVIPEGEYTVEIGASSRDIRRTAKIVPRVMKAVEPSNADAWYFEPKGLPSRSAWESIMGRSVTPRAEKKKGEFDMDSTCLEMKDSAWIMRLQYRITEMILARSFGGKKDKSDPAYKMMLNSSSDGSMRSLVINSQGMMSENSARMLLALANGQYFGAIKALFKRYK